MTHSISYSDIWERIDWKKYQKILFRLQRRIYKAIREGDKAKAKSLQKLILSSQSARMLAIRQVTQHCSTTSEAQTTESTSEF